MPDRSEGMDTADADPSTFLAAYALHALSPEETTAVETYLAAHPDAQDEAMMLREVAAMLPYSVPSIAPSPHLRTRLMATIYQDALADAEPKAAPKRPASIAVARARRSRTSGVTWPFAAAILLMLTVGFGGWAVSLDRNVNDKQHVIATQRALITASGATTQLVAAAPGVQARGELLRLASNQAVVLTINGLPPLASGKVYQVWFIEGSTPVGAGLFSPNPDGSWGGVVRGDVTTAQAIAISVEPAGGSRAPTGDIIAKGSL
jgi:anti-sigma-K factor RskA